MTQPKMQLDTFSITADEGGRKHFSWAEVGARRKKEVSNGSLPRAGTEGSRLRWRVEQVSENRALGPSGESSDKFQALGRLQ